MSKPLQIGLALGLVIASLATVYLMRSDGTPEEQAGAAAMEGHDHAAMLAGLEEAQPVALSQELLGRTGITYARVERRALTRNVTALGRIVYDETRLVDVSPKLEGWVERLYVEFTGAPVRAGQPLFDLYAPVLVAAQEELILAADLAARTDPAGERGGSAQRLLESARRRLAYWDVPVEVIDELERTREVRRTVPIPSPASGVVVEKDVVEGGRVTPGSRLYRIADLSWIWIEVDIFERDLSLVSEGQHAMISLEAYPGETFHGEVTYVYPTLDQATRTGMVRVELPNPGLRLRPGMFASLRFPVPTDGPVLMVPRSAVLETGERALVYVRAADGTLVPHVVVTGLAAGRDIEILDGLAEGEVVVSSASFLIDAESNLGSAAMNSGGVGGMESDPSTDHSGHLMDGGPADTGGAMDSSGMDHSQHQGPQPADTAGSGAHAGHTNHQD